ncbi:MAG TPA: hypothetical protein VMU42_04055, partial [Candidatus Sulfotelmatobacter sp.]|nr:hypothetical protein [Candidatus Sulfotelmatobacter sp.]
MSGLKRSEVAVLVALWAVAHLGVAIAQGPTSPFAGNLVDPDAFMRLIKIESWLKNWDSGHGGWYGVLIARDNAPYGLVLHWTRLFDLVVLLGAAPLLLCGVGLHAALFVSGAAISPLLHLAALFAVVWAFAPLVERGARPLLGLLFVAQPAVFSHFMAGRADHHSLIALLFVLLLGAMIRLLREPETAAAAVMAGIAAGLGLWVSEEGLLALALAYVALAALWLAERGAAALAGRRLSLSLLVTVMLALAIERPPGDWASHDLDRISIVHVALALAAAIFWASLAALPKPGGIRARLLAAAGAGLVPLALMLAVAPRFFLGPMADMDPRIAPIWLAHVAEARSLLHGDRGSLGRLVVYLGPVLLGAVGLARHIRARRHDPPDLAAASYLALSLAAFGALATRELRFAVPAEIVALGPLVLLLDDVMRLASARLAPALAALPRVAAVLAAAVGCTGLGLALVGHGKAGVLTVVTPTACPLQSLAALLDDPHGLGAGPKTILAFLDVGPELVYRTPHRSIASPYHRNGAGIYDAWRALATDDAGEAAAIMR